MARILLINDEPDLLAMCELVLNSAGHEAIRAFGGDQALELARANEHPPDVVLLDLVLPNLDGETIFRRLRQLAATSRAPVVVMSALPDAIETSRKLGAKVFLEKPFDPDGLLDAVTKALATRGGQP